MSKMEFNGYELQLDLMDADVMEKYEKELESISHEIKEPSQYVEKKASEQIRLQCGYVKRFFDNMFGPGTSDNLFEGRNNLYDCMEAFGMASKLAEQTRDESKVIISKYSPNRVQNREQRRANNKKNKKFSSAAGRY